MSGVGVTPYIGKRIETARLLDGRHSNGAMALVFEDNTELRFSDEGQDCCESRYMTCGDDLQSFTGARFVGWELLDAPDIEDGGEAHEVQFLHIRTDQGTIVCETHNEHNGYYGGFNVVVREVPS